MPRKPSSDPNLGVVAQRTGFSISTVSRALRNSDGIHPETRAAVIEAAAAVGYELPQSRIDLNSRPHQIMALTQQSAPMSNQRYLSGMSRASVTLNLSILSHHVSDEDCVTLLEPKFQPPAMRTGMVDGIVLIHRWPPEIAARLAEKWPIVSIVHHYPAARIDHIGIDDRAGMWSLVNQLVGGGHRKIGFFGFCKDMSWSCSRFAAYVEALVRMDLEYDPKWMVPIELKDALSPSVFAPGQWSDRLEKTIRSGVDAWICASAATGFTLHSYLTTKKYSIPEDVAIASYHGASMEAPADVPLITTTSVVDEELGSSALRRLLHRFEYPAESQRSILIPSKLLVGETTRKVAGKTA